MIENLTRVRELVLGLSDQKRLGGKSFNPQQVQRSLLGVTVAERQRWFKFAGWLWKTDTHDMRVILHVLDEAMDQPDVNEFAYYAVGSPARATVEARARERIAEEDKAEHARHARALFGR